jgi:UDP-N-acetylglucosamine--N-acetylmuramyl-(pentapeptide) pyrophosphoryl-undecaprenol N-acetylglucosamine transferase
VIFVSTGTNEAPFDRLTRAARDLPDAPLLVQYGSSGVTAGPGTWRDFLSFEEMEAAMREAQHVVVHAGVGSILLALRCQRRPLVVPRRPGIEAVDDHQLGLARRLDRAGLVRLIEDPADLPAAIAQPVAAAGAAPGPGTARLSEELRVFLVECASAPARRGVLRRLERAA